MDWDEKNRIIELIIFLEIDCGVNCPPPAPPTSRDFFSSWTTNF